MAPIRIACLQMEVAKGNPDANLERVRAGAAEAAGSGAALLILPEFWSTGFAYRRMPELAAGTPGVLEETGAICRKNKLAVCGTQPEIRAGKLYNTFFLQDSRGRLKAMYRKVHLFPPFKEDLFVAPGTRYAVADLRGIRVGLATCFDLRYPEQFRKLTLLGARLVLVAAQWPAERREHWLVLARARAVENQIYVAAVNTCGKQGKTLFSGDSLIVGPTGDVLAQAGCGETVLTADIDPKEPVRLRRKVDYLSLRARRLDEFLHL